MPNTVPHYDLELDETRPDLGVVNIAIVPRGAMEKVLVALEKQKDSITINLDKNNKQYLHCVIMSPNKVIDRLDDSGKPYTISFNGSVIKKASEKFTKDGNHKNIKLNHKNGTFIEGILVESWLVIDENMDKGKALGLSLTKEDWIGTVKVDDPSLITEDFLKNYTGFSIEGEFIPVLKVEKQEIKLEKQEKNMKIFNVFKNLFGIKVTLVEFMLKDGKKIIVDETSAQVFYMNTDGSRGEMLVDGEYELEDGRIMIIKESIFSDFKAVDVISTEMSALKTKYAELESKLAEIEKAKADEKIKADLEAAEKAKVELEANETKAKVELEAKVKELESKVIELSKQDAPIIKNVKEELSVMEQHLKDDEQLRNEMLANLLKNKNKTK